VKRSKKRSPKFSFFFRAPKRAGPELGFNAGKGNEHAWHDLQETILSESIMRLERWIFFSTGSRCTAGNPAYPKKQSRPRIAPKTALWSKTSVMIVETSAGKPGQPKAGRPVSHCRAAEGALHLGRNFRSLRRSFHGRNFSTIERMINPLSCVQGDDSGEPHNPCMKLSTPPHVACRLLAGL